MRLRPTRRQLLGATPALALTPALTHQPAALATSARAVTVTEGTNLLAAVSPDDRTIAIDLQATIWLLDAHGGAARRLLGEAADATWPSFAPDGRKVAFQSYADGGFQIWYADLATASTTQLTTGRYDHREPVYWPGDSSTLLVASDRNGSTYGLWRLDATTRALTPFVDGSKDEYHPAISPDGKQVAFVSDGTAIEVVDGQGAGRRTVVTAQTGELVLAPAFAPGGETLVYVSFRPGDIRLCTVPVAGGAPVTISDPGEDVFALRPGFLADGSVVYTADGAIKRRPVSGGAAARIPFSAKVSIATPSYRPLRPIRDDGREHAVKGIVGPVLAPDGRRVAFRALNDLWIATLDSSRPPARVTDNPYFTTDPAWSPDGRTLAYVSDEAGKPDLWLHDLAAGTHRRLTNAPGAAVLPAWSPDASQLACLDQDGNVMVADVESGNVRKVFGPLFAPGRPTWSPDGRLLALAALRPNSRRFREGTSQILTIDLETGETRYREVLPEQGDQSLSTRGVDGPVWSPDGRRLAFVLAGVLWVQPVDGKGEPTGAARRLTSDPTDAPTWSADSASLLYLVGGRLRTTTLTGRTRAHPTIPLRWRSAAPRGRTVVHAGRMWDGESDRLVEDVDILLDGNRITAVEPHRDGRRGRLVDASDATVMPGLLDMHNHRHLGGRLLGARQGLVWLTFGITTTRSPGDPIYDMVEEREAVDSGARLGPRFVATGEAIDGRRIYYNFMRPTHTGADVALELERAKLLDYDLIKTYVRLPVAAQRAVIGWAHRHRIRVSSHYLHPAVSFGIDGQEHIGATSRLGYSHTVSRTGGVYGDVTTLFAESGMAWTPTLFASAALYRDDREFYDDDRIRTLYPAWEFGKLRQKIDEAGSTDQTANLRTLRGWAGAAVRVLRAGGTIVSGTDAPIDNVAVSLHMNLRAMVKSGGATPAEALRTATSQAATYLGVPDLGRIAPGALADLAIVDGDPLARIEAAAAVRAVVLNGVPHTVDDLLTRLTPSTPAGGAAAVSPPRTPVHPSQRSYWWHTPEFVHEAAHACCMD
jgi:Tol biopolymer transport system component